MEQGSNPSRKWLFLPIAGLTLLYKGYILPGWLVVLLSGFTLSTTVDVNHSSAVSTTSFQPAVGYPAERKFVAWF